MLYRKAFATPQLTAGTVYQDGDVLGGLLSFDFGQNKPNGYIARLTLIDSEAMRRPELLLHFFDGIPSSADDHAPFEPSKADMLLHIGDLRVTNEDYRRAGDCHYVDIAARDLDFDLDDKFIYVYALVTSGTPTYSAVDNVTFKLGVYLNI